MRHVRIERFEISHRYRIGWVTVEPQLSVDASERQVTADRTLSSLPLTYALYTISSLPYDPEKDFRPITNMFFLLEGILAKAALPAGSMKELQSFAVANPGKLNFGTLGPGSTHIPRSVPSGAIPQGSPMYGQSRLRSFSHCPNGSHGPKSRATDS